jgi:4-hydroxy-tetrahydrodipicolinate reductase
MKIAIIGYGRMGKMIETIAQKRGHQIIFRFDVDNRDEFTIENLKKADVAIEFTTPESAYENVKKCMDADLPVVSGTTGWLDKMEELRVRAIKENKAFFYSSNFSIGVNIVFYLNRRLAQIMNQFDEYTPSITEVHHIHKKDAPSGTAITLAQGIIENLDRVSSWTMDDPKDDQIKITAIREDEIPGIHTITYDSDFDTIQIKHTAKGREGFATGAVMAAEFLVGKKGFFTMEDLLQF